MASWTSKRIRRKTWHTISTLWILGLRLIQIFARASLELKALLEDMSSSMILRNMSKWGVFTGTSWQRKKGQLWSIILVNHLAFAGLISRKECCISSTKLMKTMALELQKVSESKRQVDFLKRSGKLLALLLRNATLETKKRNNRLKLHLLFEMVLPFIETHANEMINYY